MHERDFIVAAAVMHLEQAPSSSQRRSGRLIDGYPDGDPKRNDCATRPDQWWHWWDVREWSVGFGDCIYAIKPQRRGAGWWGGHHSFQRPLSREMRPSTLWAALQTAFCCTCGDIPRRRSVHAAISPNQFQEDIRSRPASRSRDLSFHGVCVVLFRTRIKDLDGMTLSQSSRHQMRFPLLRFRARNRGRERKAHPIRTIPTMTMRQTSGRRSKIPASRAHRSAAGCAIAATSTGRSGHVAQRCYVLRALHAPQLR